MGAPRSLSLSLFGNHGATRRHPSGAGNVGASSSDSHGSLSLSDPSAPDDRLPDPLWGWTHDALVTVFLERWRGKGRDGEKSGPSLVLDSKLQIEDRPGAEMRRRSVESDPSNAP